MKILVSEEDLIAHASELIGASSNLSPAELIVLKANNTFFDGDTNRQIRSKIKNGEDPLGEAFSQIRSASLRRVSGATYTPYNVVSSMVSWAALDFQPDRIVDAGAGSGRFILAAAMQFPKAKLVAIEADPVAALILRANLAVRSIEYRSKVLVGDYRHSQLPSIGGKTLFIGNPPYVRHHGIAPSDKTWYANAAASFGVKASKLAGLHLHFFLRTLQLAKKGDFGIFVTSAEWLDVNYGATLRKLLSKQLGGVALCLLDPTVKVFEDAATTTAITSFRVGERPEFLRMRLSDSLEKLNSHLGEKQIPWNVVSKESRWSIFVRPGQKAPSNFVELGEICRVHRGQVTGSNKIWLEGLHTLGLPSSMMRPAVTRAVDLIRAGEKLTESSRLRRVVDIPSQLEQLDSETLRRVSAFLKWAKLQGADLSYTARHRRAWWSVGLRSPAPIICTYMARRAPAFVRNMCGARHINIAHGLYPRDRITEKTLDRLASWLRGNVNIDSGRAYAGGLIKFEPKEMERLLVPRLENLGV